MEGALGGARLPGKMRQRGRGTSFPRGVDEVPFLLCFHPSLLLAGRSLLLHSCPVSAAVAGALLLLSAQGCPGLHQHLQHAPDVFPDAGTSTTVAHQPHGLCRVDGHMGGRSDPERGPGPGRRCGLLHDDRGLPHPELRKARGLCVLSYPAPLYFGTRGQFRRSLEWQLGLGEAGKEAPKADGPPDAAAEPVRVVVLDCSGITFADAAGAREVVQLASRCRDAGIHLLLAQCHASVLGTLTQAGLLDRVTPEQLFVSVQDAAAHALERLVRTQ
uniref:STAS domain-containing protein n=1 Tax=Canis lupus dingo TaxID=286419 RepID=A0A8C0LEC3_CANLU